MHRRSGINPVASYNAGTGRGEFSPDRENLFTSCVTCRDALGESHHGSVAFTRNRLGGGLAYESQPPMKLYFKAIFSVVASSREGNVHTIFFNQAVRCLLYKKREIERGRGKGSGRECRWGMILQYSSIP